MTDDFATAMRRALEKTRAADPVAATAILQSALNGRDVPGPADTDDPAEKRRHATPASGSGRPTAPAFDFSGLPGSIDLSGLAGGLDLSALTGGHGLADLPGLGGATQARQAPVPDGAKVETRQHGSAAGSRSYRLFTPSPREGGPVGVLLMLHGCTQSPEDFALGTRMDFAAEAAGFVVAYPAQTSRDNAQSCWNWFRAVDQGRTGGEAEMLAALARDLGTEFDLEGSVFVAGLSAGGAMAAVLGETHGDVFSAIGVHSGLPAGAATDMPGAFAAMRGEMNGGRATALPAIVFHGTTDRTVSPRNAKVLVPGSGVETSDTGNGRSWSRLTTDTGSELWLVRGAGHAWFGGDPKGSYADATGPDASTEMLRFFIEQDQAR